MENTSCLDWFSAIIVYEKILNPVYLLTIFRSSGFMWLKKLKMSFIRRKTRWEKNKMLIVSWLTVFPSLFHNVFKRRFLQGHHKSLCGKGLICDKSLNFTKYCREKEKILVKSSVVFVLGV